MADNERLKDIIKNDKMATAHAELQKENRDDKMIIGQLRDNVKELTRVKTERCSGRRVRHRALQS